MKKTRFVITFVIVFLLVSINIFPVFANEVDEIGLTQDELSELLETASNVNEVPIINSRNAIIYDRTSRKNIVWKK